MIWIIGLILWFIGFILGFVLGFNARKIRVLKDRS